MSEKERSNELVDKRLFWNLVFIGAVTIMGIAGYNGLKANWDTLKDQLLGTPAAAEAPAAPEAASLADRSARLFFSAAHAGQQASMVKQEVARNLMGTRFEITLYAPAGEHNTTSLANIGLTALDRVEELERRVSSWRIDSFTAKVNREAGEGPVRVHPDLMGLLKASQTAYEDTDGAFDVTVGPLLDLWGVYRKTQHFPDDAEVRTALERVGFDKVEIDYDKRTVRFAEPGLRLDFGGIAKGYALDVAAQILRNFGIERALLSGGDSTYVAIGAPPETDGWNIVVDKIYEGAEDYIDRAVIKDEAFSLSSGEGRLFERDGKRFTHIYDPRDGKPVAATLGAMVRCPDGARADALSTTFLIYSVEEIRAYCAEHPEVGAIKVDLEEGKPRPVRINF